MEHVDVRVAGCVEVSDAIKVTVTEPDSGDVDVGEDGSLLPLTTLVLDGVGIAERELGAVAVWEVSDNVSFPVSVRSSESLCEAACVCEGPVIDGLSELVRVASMLLVAVDVQRPPVSVRSSTVFVTDDVS